MVFPQLNNLQNIENEISSLKQKYAPDRRTAVFDIEISGSENNYLISGELSDTLCFNELKDLKSKFQGLTVDVTLLPEKQLGNKIYGVVNLSVGNMRSKPEHPAELVTQNLLGTPVKILKKSKDNWLYIQTPDKYLGWIDNSAIAQMNFDELQKWSKNEKIMVTAIFSFSRSQANQESLPVSDIVAGNILDLTGDSGEYYSVKYPDGRKAFVLKSEASKLSAWLEKTDATEESILATSKLFVGVPYLWGGTSIKGFDCSGFTKTVYFLNGIQLERDASQQVRHGKKIDISKGFSELRPGDLLFFGFKASGSKPERVTHVGIYTGNLEFIHSAGMVYIDSFDSTKPNFNGYRLNMLLSARRVLGFEPDNQGIKLLKGIFEK